MAEEKKSSGIIGGDERLAKSTSRDDRSSADAERVNKDGTALTLEERRAIMRQEWTADVLPTPPAVDGWHFCWLSTTNSSDPIYKRMQKGYRPVKAAELAGFSQTKVTEGEFEGCVSCNEMILFKIEEELYQDIMLYLHHELPMSEEEMLKANASAQLQGEDSEGTKLGEVEGFDALARRVRKPHFS